QSADGHRKKFGIKFKLAHVRNLKDGGDLLGPVARMVRSKTAAAYRQKFNPAGRPAPTTATPTGKVCGKSVRGASRRVRDLPQNFVEGCEAERRLRRMQRGGAGAAVAERKRASKRAPRDAGTATRHFQRGETRASGTAVRECCPF